METEAVKGEQAPTWVAKAGGPHRTWPPPAGGGVAQWMRLAATRAPPQATPGSQQSYSTTPRPFPHQKNENYNPTGLQGCEGYNGQLHVKHLAQGRYEVSHQ